MTKAQESLRAAIPCTVSRSGCLNDQSYQRFKDGSNQYCSVENSGFLSLGAVFLSRLSKLGSVQP